MNLKASAVSMVVTVQLSSNFPSLIHLSFSVRVIILPWQPPNLQNCWNCLSRAELSPLEPVRSLLALLRPALLAWAGTDWDLRPAVFSLSLQHSISPTILP